MTTTAITGREGTALLAVQRRRTAGVLMAGVGAHTTGYIAAVTVTTLVAEEITGSATWSGVPMSAAILGTATGTSLLSESMARWGRRRGLVTNYMVGAIGATLAVTATALSSFSLLVLALFVVGLSNSGNALSRYLVADLKPAGQRGTTLSQVVWMGTIGAVLGPNLLAPAGRLVTGFGLPAFAGAYAVGLTLSLVIATTYAVALRPDPLALVVDVARPSGADGSSRALSLGSVIATPRVQIALAALVVGHVVMVLIMTMTPVSIRQAGHGLEEIGLVMSAHIVGMFLFSPLTGRWVDRAGPIRVIVAAELTLFAAALLGAFTPAPSRAGMMIALFLLGLGWNFGYVAGSALLTSDLPLQIRSRIQGLADSTVWISAAVASLASSLLLAAVGFAGLCVIGGCLVVVPITVIWLASRRSRGSRARGSNGCSLPRS